MTIIEHRPAAQEILEFVDDQIRQQSDDGVESRYIVVGLAAYRNLCQSLSVRERRGKGRFETYNFIPIVVDPFRLDEVCVVPGPTECELGVEVFRT